ncbi:TetR/AcrR family transcriptional regulator [Streptomyces gardneri]|uniref:TetR/AcrR family transcriptional regulator n=1 Tax=Streptomyces gardneri TaxID=66892 RepID=UPI0006BC4AA7|nr:TetR/AcrR family transcriptional regulator [Streptomyces gardneri]QPK50781.1 TetR/AcrR family transcriptional regulator [Streptomyces gardneri]WRK42155.1 TetR/AcrR family transcriptional regulator [Streptomyces venezuelae]CUM37981.1 Transcriptional regulator, TetR family [Streptomyces venezuelae]
MVTSRSTAAARPEGVSLRRRGAVLERAILEAALEQLGSVGWNGLTMEGVAVGAQTGKAAVYRRWPSKEDLVADALQAGLPTLDEAPDLGSVREDLYALCLRVRDVMYSKPGHALRAVLHECDAESAQRFHDLIVAGVTEPSTRLFKDVLRRGIDRGDVRADAIDGLVLDVIPALMMYRSKVCGSEWPDGEIADMIDRVMVPLLRVGEA